MEAYMRAMIKKLLGNWKAALDAQIGDTTAEIEKRRQYNAEAVRVRDDVSALIEYLETHDIPEPVRRAIMLALSWNPHTKAHNECPSAITTRP